MKHIRWFLILFACFFVVISAIIPVSGASSDLHVIKYAVDGSTALNETRVDYRWMEQNLPVKGDGTTHYYLQGPVFVDKEEDRWNPAEDTNVKEKDMGAIKGTEVRDLCNLVGGMSPGDELVVKATDGFSKTFAYENVYEPSSRQGPMVIAWYRADKGYVPEYNDGMRLIFLADASVNPWGIHAMGAWDWHESADEKYWYYYYNGNEKYPTTTGVSVQSVGEIVILSQQEPSGTIRVTSEPSGALITIDEENTGLRTPAEIPGLPPGPHAVSVESPGYENPDPIMVDVALNQVSPAAFILQRSSTVSTDSAAGGSDSSGSIVNGGEGETGASLVLYAHENIRGNISIIPVSGLEGPVAGGEERTFSLPILTPAENITFIRLYVFSSGGYDTTRLAGTDPSFLVKQETSSIKPDRIYRDKGPGAASGSVTTSCFILPDPHGPKPVTSKLVMDNPAGTSCVLEGAALVTASRNDNAPDISYWLYEGADVISALPVEDNRDEETTTDFTLQPSDPAFSDADLQFVSTSMEKYSRPGYVVEINGETFPGTFEYTKSPVRTAAMTVPAPPAGSQVHTSIRAILNESAALYGESRIVIFTLHGQKKNPVPADAPVNVSVQGTSETMRSSPGKTTPAQSTDLVRNTSVPVPSNTMSKHVSKEFSPGGFDTLDRLFALVFSMFGDNVPLDRNSANVVTVDRDIVDTSAESIPYSGQTHGEVAGADYSPRVEHSTPVTPVPATIIPTGSPTSIELKGQNTINSTGTPLQRKPVSHCGGIYITSYPANAELRVDTKKIDVVLPAVVYGLKEGIHNVEVRQTNEKDKTLVSRSLRVWVFADALTTANFDLVAGNIPRKFRINSLDNSSYSITVNGYYPIRKTPVEIEFTGPDDFFTIIRDGAHISYRPFAIASDENSIQVPPANPPLYRLPVDSSPPGGEIFVDGLWSGFTTPAVIPDLSSGLHRIIVTIPGHIPGDAIVEIPIAEGPVVGQPVSFVLDTYANGPVTIESIPSGADIQIEGIPTGEVTPHTFEHLSLGIHQVTVRRNGEARTIEVNIKPDSSNREVVLFKGKGMAA